MSLRESLRRMFQRPAPPEYPPLPSEWTDQWEPEPHTPITLDVTAYEVMPTPGWNIYGGIFDDDQRSDEEWRRAVVEWANHTSMQLAMGSMFIKRRSDQRVRLAVTAKPLASSDDGLAPEGSDQARVG